MFIQNASVHASMYDFNYDDGIDYYKGRNEICKSIVVKNNQSGLFLSIKTPLFANGHDARVRESLKDLISLNILENEPEYINHVVNNLLPNSLEYIQINCFNRFNRYLEVNNLPSQLKICRINGIGKLYNKIKIPFGCELYINGIKN